MMDVPGQQVSYAAWGEEFFRVAVTEQRLLHAVNSIAGRPIELGPIGVGPGRIAKVTATGRIGAADATVASIDEPISYRVMLPVDLTFVLDLQVDKQRFDARLEVPLTLSAQARSGCRIFIDIEPPTPEQLGLDLKAAGLRASIVGAVADVEGELRRFVANYITREIVSDRVRAARIIDVALLIDKAYA